MNTKKQCPECGRHFSEHLVEFPRFFDNNDETQVYNRCPICAFEGINKSLKVKLENPFRTEYAFKLYKEALEEIRISKERKKKVIPKY